MNNKGLPGRRAEFFFCPLQVSIGTRVLFGIEFFDWLTRASCGNKSCVGWGSLYTCIIIRARIIYSNHIVYPSSFVLRFFLWKAFKLSIRVVFQMSETPLVFDVITSKGLQQQPKTAIFFFFALLAGCWQHSTFIYAYALSTSKQASFLKPTKETYLFIRSIHSDRMCCKDTIVTTFKETRRFRLHKTKFNLITSTC